MLVSTTAQEAKNPQRDLPIGIIVSLVGVHDPVYPGVGSSADGDGELGKALNVAAPVATGIDVTGVAWGSFLVKIGAVFGLG